MGEVIHIRPNQDIPTALRNIADSVEEGNLNGDDCTLIIGMDVFHIGAADDAESAANAVFNMNFGIQKLMAPIVDVSLDK